MVTPNGKAKFIADIPTELKQDFKLYCLMNDVPMTVVAEEMVKSFLEQKGFSGQFAKKKRKINKG